MKKKKSYCDEVSKALQPDTFGNLHLCSEPKQQVFQVPQYIFLGTVLSLRDILLSKAIWSGSTIYKKIISLLY